MASAADVDLEAFVDEYVGHHGANERRDPETLRENAEKYATSLRGHGDRMGWFEWLDAKRDKSHADAEERDVRRYLTYLRELGYASSTRTQARSAISQFHKRMGFDGENPAAGLDDLPWSHESEKQKANRDERTYLTTGQVKALVENAPEPTFRSKLIIKLLYHTGVRRTELAKIQVEDVDIEEREIDVYGDKADEWRTVTFKDSLRSPLNTWIKGPRKGEFGYSDENPYLFPYLSGRAENDHISGQTIWQTVVDAAENAGIQETYGQDVNGQSQYKITPHTMRHTFAYHSAENGVPAPHLKEVLGHHDLKISQIYLDAAGQDAVDMLKDRGPSL